LTLLDRALQIHVLDLLAQIGSRADELDEAVLDGEKNVGTLLDILGGVSDRFYDELLAAGRNGVC